MQFKLLNIYNVISNFATSLIGAFVPILVYVYTNNLLLAFVPVIAFNFLGVLLNRLFKKLLYNKPQLLLLLRAIPLVLFQLCILFLEFNPILAIVLMSIFAAFNYCFKGVPVFVIMNYASQQEKEKSNTLGIMTFFEQVGFVAAGVLGGLFLDQLHESVVVGISLALYILSCIPLVVFYFKNRKEKYFNAEDTSNAQLQFQQHADNSSFGKKVTNKFKRRHYFSYVLISTMDAGYSFFALLIFIHSGTFAMAGLMYGLFDALYGISSYFIGKLDNKKDLTVPATISCIIIALAWVAIPFLMDINLFIVIGVWAVLGALYPILVIFIYGRMTTKAQILGITNDCQMLYFNSFSVGYSTALLFIGFGFIPAFIAIGATGIMGGLTVPYVEEKNRALLLDYLQDGTSKQIKDKSLLKRKTKKQL